jgi:hypothetical protein
MKITPQVADGQRMQVPIKLLAVYLTLQFFCSSMCNVHIRALIDNTTAVTYVVKMGGMKENLSAIIA